MLLKKDANWYIVFSLVSTSFSKNNLIEFFFRLCLSFVSGEMRHFLDNDWSESLNMEV